MVLTFGLTLAIAQAKKPLTIENLAPGSKVYSPMIVVKGVSEDDQVNIGVDGQKTRAVPAYSGYYVGLVQLKPGANMVVVKGSSSSVKVRVTYEPSPDQLKVRPVFLLGADEEPTFMGLAKPDENEVRNRFSTALKMIQAFTAEAMFDAGFGRRSFAMDYDQNGLVEIKFLKSKQTGATMRSKSGDTLWGEFYTELQPQFDFDKEKLIVVMGATQYLVNERKPVAHTALGGGALALFGSGSMRFWPRSLADVPRALLDTTRVDPKEMFDDSAYRETAWANCSTTVGAMLHELGHTFGLPHTNDPDCIMSRGFDHINRALIAGEPDKTLVQPILKNSPLKPSRWDPFFATRLAYHPWFQAKPPAHNPSDAPRIRVDGDKVVIQSEAGLRVVGAWEDNKPNWYQHFAGATPPKETTLSLEELKQKVNSARLHIYAMNAAGQEVNFEVR